MSIQDTCYISTNTSTFLPVLCSCSLPSQLAYNARHDTTHASVSWLMAPHVVIGLATELATSRLSVRHASFLLRHTYYRFRVDFRALSLMKPIRFVSGVVENRSSRIAVGVSTISNIDCNSRRRIRSKKSTRHFNMPNQMLASVGERWKLFRLVRGYGWVGIHQCPLVTWEMLHASLKRQVSECTHWILIVMINFRGLNFKQRPSWSPVHCTAGIDPACVRVMFILLSQIVHSHVSHHHITFHGSLNMSDFETLIITINCSDCAIVLCPATLDHSLTRSRKAVITYPALLP